MGKILLRLACFPVMYYLAQSITREASVTDRVAFFICLVLAYALGYIRGDERQTEKVQWFQSPPARMSSGEMAMPTMQDGGVIKYEYTARR
jgi:hypothetical protein